MSIRKPAVVIILLGVLVLTFGAGYSSYPLLHGSDFPQSGFFLQYMGNQDMDLFWDVWKLLDRDFYGDKPDNKTRAYGAIHGMVGSFDDPYTFFVEPSERELERDDLRGSFGGIGANIVTTDDGFTLQPLPGQPAAIAGIEADDLLLIVDGTEVLRSMSVNEIATMIRGEVGTHVNIVVRRIAADGTTEELTFRIERSEIETPSIQWRMADLEFDTDGVGIIQQSSFTERSPAEMRTAIEELSALGAESFVLDLRGNAGGLVESAVAIADMWLSEGDILIEQHANGSESVFSADEETVRDDAGVIILVDGGSASASEIVAGALRDNGRGTIVGQTTYGKGSVQLVHELPDESSLHVTNAQWLTPNRVQISGRGLQPDIAVVEGSDALAIAVQTANNGGVDVEIARLPTATASDRTATPVDNTGQ